MRIGIDLGGTKIEGVALSESGVELFRQRVATPQGDYRATLQSIVDLINLIEKDVGEQGSIGIGTPGCTVAGERSIAQFQFGVHER